MRDGQVEQARKAGVEVVAAQVACTTFAPPVSKSTQSGHFRVLREAGVIRQRDEGSRRLNSPAAP